jgi:hypothetical protein
MGWWILRDWHSVSHLIKSQLSPLANHLDTSKQIQMCIHTSQPPIKPFTFEGVVVIQPLLLLSSTPPLLRRLLSKEGDKLYLEKFLGTVKSVVAEHFKLDNFVERDMTGAFIAYGVFQEDLWFGRLALPALIQSFVIADFPNNSLLELFALRILESYRFLRLCFEKLCFAGGIGFARIAERRVYLGLSVVVSSIVVSDHLGCALLSFDRIEELFLLEVW